MTSNTMEEQATTVRQPSYNIFLSWLITPPYIFLFFAILVVFHPVIVIAGSLSDKLFHRSVVRMCRALIQNLYVTAGTQFAYRKWRELPKDRPLLIVSNHQSMYDIPMLIDAFSDYCPRFISKRELAKWLPSISYTLRRQGSALIDRSDRRQSVIAIREAAKSTRSDKGFLCIFPEGTRARDGVVKKFKGAGFAAALEGMADAIIVPVAIGRSWELLRYNLLPIPARVKVSLVMLEPVEPNGRNPYELLGSVEGEIRKTVTNLEMAKDGE